MLAETNAKTKIVWNTVGGDGHATFIPSALLLLMAIDNGWDIAKVKLEPSCDQHGFVYLVTLHRDPEGQNQELIIPRSALVDKILEQYSPAIIPVC
jgi:hypothetical protein